MNRLKTLIATTGLLLSSFSWLTAVPVRAEAPAACTWDGGGASNDVDDLANWDAGCTEVPTIATDVLFPITATKKTVNIDHAGPAFKSITINGVSASATGYTFTGDLTLAVANGIANTSTGTANTSDIQINLRLEGSQEINFGANTLNIGKTDNSNTLNMNGKDISNITGSATVTVNSVISGAGNITSNVATLSLKANNTSWTGTLTVSGGMLDIYNDKALGATSAGTTIADAAKIQFTKTGNMTTDITIAEPMSLGANPKDGSNKELPKVSVNGLREGGSAYSYKPGPYFVLSGAITLTANVIVTGVQNADLKITGAISGAGKTFTVESGKDFELVLAGSSNGSATPNGTYRSSSGSIYVNNGGSPTASGNETLIVNPDVTANDITINSGAFLKGTGKVKGITVNSAFVAPGMSPGCLTATGAVVFTKGALVVEISGKTPCDKYDQLVIDTEGTINLNTGENSADIEISRGEFVPAVGDKFMVINNKNTVAIEGTFAGWAEGIAKKIGDVTYVITYKGGDGNDVVIEVSSVSATASTTSPSTPASTAETPGTPNTGITPAKVFANLLIVSFIGVAISWVLVNRNKRSTVKGKR